MCVREKEKEGDYVCCIRERERKRERDREIERDRLCERERLCV